MRGALSPSPEQVEYAEVLLRRANGDLYVCSALSDDAEVDDGVLGFHAQQAVEKALKVALVLADVERPPPRAAVRESVAPSAVASRSTASLIRGGLDRGLILNPRRRRPEARAAEEPVLPLGEYQQRLGANPVELHRIGSRLRLHDLLKGSHVGDVHDQPDPIRTLRVSEGAHRDSQRPKNFLSLR